MDAIPCGCNSTSAIKFLDSTYLKNCRLSLFKSVHSQFLNKKVSLEILSGHFVSMMYLEALFKRVVLFTVSV